MCVASSNCCLRTIDTGQQQRQQRQHQWRFVEAAGEEERAGMMTGVSHSAVSQGFLNGQSASSSPTPSPPTFCPPHNASSTPT